MVHDYLLGKILDKIKKIIGIEKNVKTNVLIDRYDKLQNGIILRNFGMLIAWY